MFNSKRKESKAYALASEIRQKPSSFSDLKRINDTLQFLETDVKIMNVRIMSLERAFDNLKKEFDVLTELCAKKIVGEVKR